MRLGACWDVTVTRVPNNSGGNGSRREMLKEKRSNYRQGLEKRQVGGEGNGGGP
jgi:hypothetical protein